MLDDMQFFAQLGVFSVHLFLLVTNNIFRPFAAKLIFRWHEMVSIFFKICFDFLKLFWRWRWYSGEAWSILKNNLSIRNHGTVVLTHHLILSSFLAASNGATMGYGSSIHIGATSTYLLVRCTITCVMWLQSQPSFVRVRHLDVFTWILPLPLIFYTPAFFSHLLPHKAEQGGIGLVVYQLQVDFLPL